MVRVKAAPKEKMQKEPRLRRTAPLTNDEANFLYSLYLFLFNSSLSLHGKYRTFETAAVDIFPWPITHISARALEYIVEKGTATGLRRGHRMQRKTRGEQLFDRRSAPIEKAEMLEFFLVNDKVTLVIGKENGKEGVEDWSPQVEVPSHILVGGSYSVYATKIDKAWAREQWAILPQQSVLP